MSGILSPHPSAWALRLLIGAELLLFVTIILVLESARTLDQTLVAIAAALVLTAAAAFLLAIVGERLIKGGRRGH